MANAIRLTDVTKRFSGVTAVDGLTLTVPEGSIYGFIGPNGSGKTTTLRMIMNILLPDQGAIEVLGSGNTAAARDRVSYLPEERGLYKKMTVRRLLRFYGQLKGRTIAELDPAIDDWMSRLGMQGWGEKKIEGCRRRCSSSPRSSASRPC
jgi:ABC-2 type transport system ATP-binding protein